MIPSTFKANVAKPLAITVCSDQEFQLELLPLGAKEVEEEEEEEEESESEEEEEKEGSEGESSSEEGMEYGVWRIEI